MLLLMDHDYLWLLHARISITKIAMDIRAYVRI